MKKYEYKILRTYTNEVSVIEKLLNEFGSNNWELVNMRTFMEYKDIGYEMVFKRKIKKIKEKNNILNG